MKRILAFSMAALLSVSVLAACGSSSSSAATTAAAASGGSSWPKMEIKMSTIGTEQGVDTIAAQKFADLVKEETDGQITVTVYANGTLTGGSMQKQAELSASGGAFEMAMSSGSTLSNLGTEFLIHMIPFVFNDYAEATEYLTGSGSQLYRNLLEPKGIVLFDGVHNGMRQLTTSNKEVHNLADLKGLKIRVPNGDVYMKSMQALGADPTAMSWTEVFTALQQGALDGEENSYKTVQSANLQEVQKCITEWNWSYDAYWFTANKKAWDSYPEEVRTMLEEKIAEACAWERKQFEDEEAGIKKEFEDLGLTIIELTPEEKQEFVDAVAPVVETFKEQYGAENCAAWGIK